MTVPKWILIADPNVYFYLIDNFDLHEIKLMPGVKLYIGTQGRKIFALLEDDEYHYIAIVDKPSQLTDLLIEVVPDDELLFYINKEVNDIIYNILGSKVTR